MTTETTDNRKAIPEMAAETRLLLQALRDMRMEQMETYAHLNQISGCNVQGTGRGYLNAARKRVLIDYGIVTECVRGEGIKRLADRAIVDTGHSALKHIRRTAKRAGSKLSVVNLEALSQDERTKHLAMASGLAMIAHCSQPKQVQALEEQTRNSALELPVGRVLEVFTEKRKV